MVLLFAPGCRWAQAWCLAWAIVWCATAAAAPPARGAGGAGETGPVLSFDLPSQSLEQGLSDFGGLTGHSVLVDSAMTQGRMASPVRGVLSAHEALRQLLAGTGLSARYSGRNAFTLVPDDAAAGAAYRPDAVDGVPSGGAALPVLAGVAPATGVDFAGALQAALTGALCAAQPDSFGRYRAALQLWIGPEGRVRRAHLLASSGVTTRDQTLLAALRNLAVGRAPPPGLAQPLAVLLSPHADPAAACRGVAIGG